MESKRQKQVARVVKEAISDIFMKEGKEITENAMVTISQVKMTPDLYTARVYFSIFNSDHPDEIMYYIQNNVRQVRGLLGKRIGKQLRSVPQLEFFKDDTLNEVFKLEQIFKDLKKEKGEDTEEQSQ